MTEKKDEKKKDFSQSGKAKRGWWFSVFFMILIVCLILFLSFVKIVDENRDVLIGMLGMLTGAISSMLSIAAGRDPAEIDELKEALGKSEGDRQALIARLRDAQIQMQLLREQQFELQTSIINKLSIFQGEKLIKTVDESQVMLHPAVEEWTPNRDKDYSK